MLKKIKINVSAGELVDKITILELKASKITDGNKLVFILKELKQLHNLYRSIESSAGNRKGSLRKHKKSLFNINKKLWSTEDKIRKHEAQKKFGKKFISLARTVYLDNDKRSEIKAKINILLGSDIIEVKQYTKYKK